MSRKQRRTRRKVIWKNKNFCRIQKKNCVINFSLLFFFIFYSRESTRNAIPAEEGLSDRKRKESRFLTVRQFLRSNGMFGSPWRNLCLINIFLLPFSILFQAITIILIKYCVREKDADNFLFLSLPFQTKPLFEESWVL